MDSSVSACPVTNMLEWIGTIRGGKGTVNYKFIYLYIVFTIRDVQAVPLGLTEDIVKLLYGDIETSLFSFQMLA